MTLAESTRFGPTAFTSLQSGSPALLHGAKVFAILFAGTIMLQLADERQFNGLDVWVKPAKFFLSLALQMLTLAWGMSLIAGPLRSRFRLDRAAWLFVALATFEMSYIVYRASRGEASHFNHSSQMADVLYAMMGLAAVTMMLDYRLDWFCNDEKRNTADARVGCQFHHCRPANDCSRWFSQFATITLDRRRPDRRHRASGFCLVYNRR